jgi:hypothetical protein
MCNTVACFLSVPFSSSTSTGSLQVIGFPFTSDVTARLVSRLFLICCAPTLVIFPYGSIMVKTSRSTLTITPTVVGLR